MLSVDSFHSCFGLSSVVGPHSISTIDIMDKQSHYTHFDVCQSVQKTEKSEGMEVGDYLLLHT